MEEIKDAEVELDGGYLYCPYCYNEIFPTQRIIICDRCKSEVSCKWVFDNN